MPYVSLGCVEGTQMMRESSCRIGIGAALVVLLAGACFGASISTQHTPAIFVEDHPASGGTMTASSQDLLGVYLASASEPVSGDGEMLYLAVVEAGRDSSGVSHDSRPIVFAAPLEPEPTVQLASFAYPQITGLAGGGSDERAVPLANANVLALSPGGFGRVMSGKPDAGTENWIYANETAISYIRPHVNMQMMLSVELRGGGETDAFEGPGLNPHASLVVDHKKEVDSADIGTATDRFGRRPAPVPVDEPQTAVAAGLDLGLLPTFLAQMGLNVSVVASRGRETGDLRIALVGTAELPVDLPPREEPRRHLAVNPLGVVSNPWQYPSGAIAGGIAREGNGGNGGPTPIIPIIPVIPEPATLSLMGVALVTVVLHRRRCRRRKPGDLSGGMIRPAFLSRS